MCLPENVVVYLNEQKVVSKAAVLTDEFSFSAVHHEKVSPKCQTRSSSHDSS